MNAPPDPNELPDPGESMSESPGEPAGPFAEPGAGADPTADAGGSGSTFRDALNRTEPHRDLSEIEEPFDVENGAEKRLYRGFQKASGTEGVPAWVDLCLGAVEIAFREIKDADDVEEPDAGAAVSESTGGADMGGEINA